MTELEIMAFSDVQMVSLIGTTVVLVHPDAMHIAASLIDETRTFRTTPPTRLDVEFVLDATGVVPRNAVRSVPEAVERFKNLAYDYNGNIHSPNFLRLKWDGNELCCRLAELALDYQLFDPSGTPLRCKLSARFDEHQSPDALARQIDRKSADLTHSIDTVSSTYPTPETQDEA